MTPRPLRNPVDVTPIWKGEPVGRKRTAKKRAKDEKYLAEQRQVCFERDGWACVVCGGTRGLNAHHVRERSLGGSHDAENLLTVCQGPGTEDCHGFLHAHPAWAKGAGLLK